MPSAWITHVKSVYAAGEKKNSSYTYGQAMKDGKSSYKRGAKASTAEPDAPKKRRRKKKSKKVKKSEEDEE